MTLLGSKRAASPYISGKQLVEEEMTGKTNTIADAGQTKALHFAGVNQAKS